MNKVNQTLTCDLMIFFFFFLGGGPLWPDCDCQLGVKYHVNKWTLMTALDTRCRASLSESDKRRKDLHSSSLEAVLTAARLTPSSRHWRWGEGRGGRGEGLYTLFFLGGGGGGSKFTDRRARHGSIINTVLSTKVCMDAFRAWQIIENKNVLFDFKKKKKKEERKEGIVKYSTAVPQVKRLTFFSQRWQTR